MRYARMFNLVIFPGSKFEAALVSSVFPGYLRNLRRYVVSCGFSSMVGLVAPTVGFVEFLYEFGALCLACGKAAFQC